MGIWLVGCQPISKISGVQKKPFIAIQLEFDQTPLQLNKTYSLPNSEQIEVQTLRFHLSNFAFYQNEKIVWQEANSYHLIDAADSASLSLLIPTDLIFNTLRFNIGIDSTTHEAGVMSGDLDPTKGMYWTWQSGYINFKLEGKSNKVQANNKQFKYHLGGYQAPFNTLQTVRLNVNPNRNLTLSIDIATFLKSMDLSKDNILMSPSEKAVRFSEQLPFMFRMF